MKLVTPFEKIMNASPTWMSGECESCGDKFVILLRDVPAFFPGAPIAAESWLEKKFAEHECGA